MKKFLIKAILITLFIAGALFVSFRYIRAQRYPYNAQTMAGAIIDKHARLRTLPSPRILIIGGSNAMFGYNSREMEKKLGLPVQNMSLAASLGLSFMLNEVKENVRAGDIVLFSPEYFLTEGDANVQRLLRELYKPAGKYIDYTNKLEALKADGVFISREIRNYILLFMFRKPVNTDDEAYSRRAFTETGDLKDSIRLQTHLPLRDGLPFSKTDYSHNIAKINNCIAQIEQKGAKLYFVYPSIAQSQYQRNAEAIEDLHQQFTAKLHTQMLNKPIDSVYPDSSFYDTVYHLRSPDYLTHTNKVTGYLQAVLKK
ncbi:hypothetical protein [Emticicia sp. 17c]|uniref:hypothetical protein n=1 Tax=Emticicia sp. 17c TaxID=3127704 RepID=UPI00301BC884